MIQCDGFTLEVVRVNGGWAQKAVVNGNHATALIITNVKQKEDYWSG